MDLSSMLNDGPAPERKVPRASPTVPTRPHPGTYPVSTQGNNQYGPPSLLASPGQPASHGMGQYPFPPQLSQSPGTVSGGQQYRQYESHMATTPGSRPSSHGLAFAQPSPSYHGPPQERALGQSGHLSHSPTPSSHHSQTPRSVRASPLAGSISLPGQSHYAHPTPNSAHPSTPLGPPQPISRNSGPLDQSSPYHGRAVSNTSESRIPISPALQQQQFGVNNVRESPSAVRHSPPLRRSTSEYTNTIDRERSVSVSPKTKVPQRTPSIQSQSSGQPDAPSLRGSTQRELSASQAGVMPMLDRALSSAHRPFSQEFMRTPSENIRPTESGPIDLLSDGGQGNGNQGRDVLHAQREDLRQSSLVSQEHVSASRSSHTPQPSSSTNKRSAETDLSPALPLKKAKRAPFARPMWAVLDRANPRYQNDGQSAHSAQPSQLQPSPHPRSAPLALDQATAGSNGAYAVSLPAEPADPASSIDHDLLKARQILGPWERCICRDPPAPGLLIAVSHWLAQRLNDLREVGTDPREGSVEIEAKIGTIVDINTGQRLKLPVESPVVLSENFNKSLRFESQMSEIQHMSMNKFLNKTLQDTLRKEHEAPSGRVSMMYKHTYETDNFQPLSDVGLQILPQTFQRRIGRDFKLRTTIDDKTKQVVARIAKVHIANLHIYSPQNPYDCRITINLEVNLDRPGLDPEMLINQTNNIKDQSPPRRKDRLSYKHLAYSIDLTKVLVNGQHASYELELEVDATLLRRQLHLAEGNQPNAYTAVIEGFLDNAAWLMRGGSLQL